MPVSRISTESRRSYREVQPSSDILSACDLLGLPTSHIPETVAAVAVTTARLVRDRAMTNELAYELREVRLREAELADRDRFSEALAAGMDDPGPVATLAAQEELAMAERRVDALDHAESGARRELLTQIEEATPTWQTHLDSDVETSRVEYMERLEALRFAHAKLASHAGAARWLRDPSGNRKAIVALGMLPETENITRTGYPLNTTDVLVLLERLGESA